ncbi:MAG: S1 RNA-binding domain-containing protein [Oscillospiraceae bacterium]|nr:S1 RNA-binding domain-containing protein [Oscillospiraceae bacterium]
MKFMPEGCLIETEHNTLRTSNIFALSEASKSGDILEGRAIICDAAHNLIVALGDGIRGIIPREEGAIGIKDGTTKDIAIISRVNKPVCFVVTGFDTISGQVYPILSRAMAQQRCRDNFHSQLDRGDIIDAKVTHMENFGCFVDIGCGICSMIPIDAISVSRISHPRDRFKIGQDIRVIVKDVEPSGRILLTHKELLGTWEQNAAMFSAGETVAGIVRSVEPYGAFIELAPNLAGLAEPRDEVTCGQQAGVYIKSLIPQKMKVKLIIVDSFPAHYPTAPIKYFYTENHIDDWIYSPENCSKVIQSRFESRF